MPEVDEHDSTNAVVVPRISCPLSDDDLLELKAEHSPLCQSDAFGIDIYVRVVEHICGKLGCSTGFM